MFLAEVPAFKPKITNINQKYRIGEVLNVNCTSENSKPSSNLTWLIDDNVVSIFHFSIPCDVHCEMSIHINQNCVFSFIGNCALIAVFFHKFHLQVNPQHVKQYGTTKDNKTNLESTTLGLFFLITHRHFKNGKFKVSTQHLKIDSLCYLLH
jgi:hypothetical protein